MIYYKPKHFIIQELVDPNTFLTYGPERSWHYTNTNLNRFIDMLKDRYSPNVPMIINNYHKYPENEWGNTYIRKFCGRRTIESPFYKPDSFHSFCCAYDLTTDRSVITEEEIREDLRSQWGKLSFQDFPIQVKRDKGYLHVQTGNFNKIYEEID